MMVEEALTNYCRRMISRFGHKQQQPESSEEDRRRHKNKGSTGRKRSGSATRAVPGDECRVHREGNLPKPHTHQNHLSLVCEGPGLQPVPLKLILMLRLKALKERMMRRAAEAELHDPAVCSLCEQEQAAVALKTFIWRKRTQLQLQILTGRLNTLDVSHAERTPRGSLCKFSQSPSMPLTGFGRNYLVGHSNLGCLSND